MKVKNKNSIINYEKTSSKDETIPRCFKLTIEPNRRDSYHFMQVYIEKKATTFSIIFGVLLNKHYKTG